MCGGWVYVVGQVLQYVVDVYYDGVVLCGDWQLFVFVGEYFQFFGVGVNQQCDEVDVFVGVGVYVGDIVLGDWWVVDWLQD